MSNTSYSVVLVHHVSDDMPIPIQILIATWPSDIECAEDVTDAMIEIILRLIETIKTDSTTIESINAELAANVPPIEGIFAGASIDDILIRDDVVHREFEPLQRLFRNVCECLAPTIIVQSCVLSNNMTPREQCDELRRIQSSAHIMRLYASPLHSTYRDSGIDEDNDDAISSIDESDLLSVAGISLARLSHSDFEFIAERGSVIDSTCDVVMSHITPSA